MSEAVGDQNKQQFTGGKFWKREVIFFDKKNYVGGEKMIQTNRTGKGNKKDKVKNVNKTVSAVFIVFSEHIAINKSL